MQKTSGFTLIEILVGIALTLIIFTGIFGAYRLGIKVLGQSKARIGAIALVNEQIEKIRNLSYVDVGTYSCKPEYPNCDPNEPSQIIQGYPFGKMEDFYEKTFNNVLYTVETKVDYTVDNYDGVADPSDVCPNDYKKVKVVVSWSGRFSGQVDFDTIISPKNSTQECAETGGVLKITVFDASGQFVPLPEIKVININTSLEKTAMPENGVAYITLPPATSAYRIEVSKSGYSSERTYAPGEVYNSQIITTPTKPHATMLEGELTETSFSIDRLSSLTVNSHAEAIASSFIDSFFDSSKIAESSNIVVNNGAIKLAKENTTQYYSSGYVISQTIEPSSLSAWNTLNYTDNSPSRTQIRYQALYFNGENWILVPDVDLPGNSAGLHHPPIDLERMEKETYPKIRLQATLFSQGVRTKTPTLYDWTATWLGSSSAAINSVVFTLQGQKLIGKTSTGQSIYKYLQNKQTSSGVIVISDLEWDIYSISVNKAQTGFDLTRTDPAQPINLNPNLSQSVSIFLQADNNLLVSVKNSQTGSPIFSANTRLYNASLNYDQALLTDENGQAFFLPLSVASYTLETQASGFQNATTTISVSGSTGRTINLTPQ